MHHEFLISDYPGNDEELLFSVGDDVLVEPAIQFPINREQAILIAGTLEYWLEHGRLPNDNQAEGV